MSESKTMAARKLVDSSFIWRRSDGSYSCLGGASVIDGLFYYCQQKGIPDEVFGKSVAKAIDDYFRKREIDSSNSVIEDKCNQYHDTFRGTMLIESRSKKEEKKHRLRVSDVVTKNSTDERKGQSLRSMNLLCYCTGAHYQTILTIPRYVRQLFDDSRETDSLPSPQILMAIDIHSVTGMNWLVEERGAEDFGIFGLSGHTIEIAKHMAGSALDERMPEHELNSFLRDRTDLFKPLKERLEN
jgi:hypothetical protein